VDNPSDPFARLIELVASKGVLVLSGAGMSTESGIPDYRGPTGKLRESSPILHREFLSSSAARSRYWARSTVGWPHVTSAQPNSGHLSITVLQSAGLVDSILTQNVDGLHQAAGSKDVLELHGSLHSVVCLGCAATFTRDEVQQMILRDNHGWNLQTARFTPDGDAVLPQSLVDAFIGPTCPACGADLKPDVVFFGDTVPATIVQRAWRMLELSRALLVLGSSLTVYSGFRFAERAARLGIPVAIVNIGPTRADAIAAVKVESSLGETLWRLCESLSLDVPSHQPAH
jgi:NAD-dependent SIR2 family protein deacetylase